MAKLRQSKFGYQTAEWNRADADLEKWLEKRKKDVPKKVRPFKLPAKREKLVIDWRN